MVGLQQVVRSFGFDLVGTMHPRMLWLSLRPFLIVSVLWGCLIWLTWTPALEALSIFLTTSVFTSWIQDGLIWAGFENARAFIAPLFFVMLIIPLITISLLVLIAFSTVPAIVRSVIKQSHYQDLECKRGGGLFGSLVYTLWSAFICLALVLLFMENLMIAARGHGLHTCPQAAWNGFSSIVLPHIGAGDNEMLVCAIALGYADETAKVNTFRTPRVSAAEFTTWLE